MMAEAISAVSKSWFCVFDNPADHGFAGSPEEVCDQLRNIWISGSTTRTGAWAYCISATGMRHVHMVLEDNKAMRFSTVKAIYPATHIEITRGSKAQAEAYIHKCPPYDESGETVVCMLQEGEICGRQGQRTDLEMIEALLSAGYTPREIYRENLSYRRYANIIRDEYFDRQMREIGPIRDVTVHYRFGPSGSGKSYYYIQLCDQIGREQIYHVSDYANGCFDNYSAEPILFLDELKGTSISYATLLTLLDNYVSQTHARYSNVYMLWKEVYITSVFSPEELYDQMVPTYHRETDTLEQLTRRITDITYCYLSSTGEHESYTLDMADYRDANAMKTEAMQSCPFNEVG